MSAATAAPPFHVAAAALRETTEKLAAELVQPSSEAPDWDEFEWAVARAAAAMQGISSLLAKRLTWRAPARWQRFLDTQREQGLRRDANIGELLARIDQATRHENVAVIALKGAALRALSLYEPGDRPMGDIDLLARPEDLPAVARALQTLGYHEAYATRRHNVFASRATAASGAFGEHVDNPVLVEVHARIGESLPVTMVDITAQVAAGIRAPGINAYPDRAALLAHLLLHAAGNIRAHAFRLLQLEDIARLARHMTEDDWHALRASGGADQCWWGLPPLLLAKRYCAAPIPDAVIASFAALSPRRLRHAARGYTLTEVSWSNLRIGAFPGIEWSRSMSEALRFARSRVFPSKAALDELNSTTRSSPALRTIPWYGQRHVTRILRWLFTQPPRVQTLRSVLESIADGRSRANASAPAVSVILPVFNRLAYLRAAVASVFDQTFTDWELIVADDGSDAETKAYLQEIARLPRVTLLSLAHSGNPAAVRNAALRVATGEFIAFLDSDDEWLPAKLATQLAVLREQPENAWCCSPILHIDAEGNLLPRKSHARRWVRQSVAFEGIARWEAAIALPTVIVRKELVDRVGGFDERKLLHEDYDLWLKLARESEVSFVDSALTRVRHHGNHYSKTGEPELRDWIDFFAGWQLRVKEPGRRRVVERQGARCTAMLARHYAARGDRASVFRTITHGAKYWTCPEWWFGNAIAIARLVVPARLVDASRRSFG